eukprot:3482882-Amphidinium_carterae.1
MPSKQHNFMPLRMQAFTRPMCPPKACTREIDYHRAIAHCLQGTAYGCSTSLHCSFSAVFTRARLHHVQYLQPLIQGIVVMPALLTLQQLYVSPLSPKFPLDTAGERQQKLLSFTFRLRVTGLLASPSSMEVCSNAASLEVSEELFNGSRLATAAAKASMRASVPACPAAARASMPQSKNSLTNTIP